MPRHYIVVVHGIGEQEISQTATPVVHRFAETRQGTTEHFEPLTPSYLSAQSVRRGGKIHGWSEFDGIPVTSGKPTGDFDGTPGTNADGENFRFVDINWQDILGRHQEKYASPVEEWARALMDRSIDFNEKYCGWYPNWTLPLLKSIVNAALAAKRLLALKYSAIVKTVFEKYLGDVHLYGDYARTRGKAVRHFHIVLDEIMMGDFIQWCYRNPRKDPKTEYHLPEFTIIAHSLGSIMSFDALVYAHAADSIRRGQNPSSSSSPSLPFLGYTYENEDEKESWRCLTNELKKIGKLNDFEGLFPHLHNGYFQGPNGTIKFPEIPMLTWRNQIRNFITFGSPIDKYLVMWHQNYRHMGLNKPNPNNDKPGFSAPGDWKAGVNGWLFYPPAPANRIHHHNFCDEQDPVGHHLDVAEASDNYGQIFEMKNDVVFRRYSKPGVAHNMYWEDAELFKGFVEEIIDTGGITPLDNLTSDGFREGPRAFRQALLWAYFRLPFVAALLTGVLIIYAVFGGTPIFRFAAVLGAVFLWIRPSLLEAYQEEADPEDYNENILRNPNKWWVIGKLFKVPRKGILAHLVSGMVEWRRILRRLRKSEKDDSADKHQLPDSYKFGLSFWWRFAWRFGVALVAADIFLKIFRWDFGPWKTIYNPVSTKISLIDGPASYLANLSVDIFLNGAYWTNLFLCLKSFADLPPIDALPLNKIIGAGGTILTVSYLAIMIYVLYSYLKAKYFPRGPIGTFWDWWDNLNENAESSTADS